MAILLTHLGQLVTGWFLPLQISNTSSFTLLQVR